jgi:hypothetical protein
MNLLDTLDLSPAGALLVVAAGIMAAVLWAARRFRKSSAPTRHGLGLEDR